MLRSTIIQLGLPLLLVLGTGCATAPARGPTHLSLTYFGVAGWSISDGAHTVLVDPYFSRPADPFHGATPDLQAIAAHAPKKVDLILVGHPHVDHALDAPAIAQQTGANLLAAPEVLRAGHDAGVPDDRLLTLQGGQDYAFDGFSVRVIPSLHSAIGFANGADVPTFAFLIRIGGREVLVLGTANFIEREVAGLRPDVAIVATGLREKIHDYSCRLMQALGEPGLVVTNHFDAWKKPAGLPLDADTQADMKDFEREVHRCAPAARVVMPVPFQPIPVP